MTKKNRMVLVAGNWKMNPATLAEAKKLFTAIKDGLKRTKGKAKVALATPATFIAPLTLINKGNALALGAQNVNHQDGGAHTGELSISMLKSVGADLIIIGHSERRALGESNELVAEKLGAVLKCGGTAILCVGEKERDGDGAYLSFVEEQIQTALSGIPKTKLKQLIIAYEPIWAIGTGKTATAADAHEMRIFIKKIITDLFDRPSANRLMVLYGGSVKPGNADELLKDGEVDGFLIGGASLIAKDFLSIVKSANTYLEN